MDAEWNTTYIYSTLSLPPAEVAPSNVTMTAAPPVEPATSGINDETYLENERLAEGLYLMVLALGGISLNFMIFCCVFLYKHLRHFLNGFIIHGCVLDAFKSALCIPYSLAVLQLIPPGYCNALGLAYVVTLTVSMFNLLAMVMAEAYIFHEHNIDDKEDGSKGAAMCIAFGVVTIYIGSVILHLGPTLIGGEFKFNKDVGNCIFAYGKVQNYIVQVIWVIIFTLTLIVILRYIYKFYRQLKANQRFRITNLARNAAAYSKGKNPNEDIYELVHNLKRRVRVLLIMAIIYSICWYPLFFLTVLDYSYTQPRYLYRVLTVIAWSHSALIPIVLLSMDHDFGVLQQIRAAAAKRAMRKPYSPSTQPLTREDSTLLGSQHLSLYNNTMQGDGRAITYTDSPIPNHNAVYETVRSEPPVSPTRQTLSSGPQSEYEALSLEESPL